jgi:glycosyltransferase involved in cell wall biosynthesis
LPELSLVVITRDAGAQIAACLASVRFAAETLVVDSGSRDDTVEIARAHGARVIEQPWLGFGPQRRYAVAQAANDWVLCVDADEQLSPELAVAIAAVLQQPRHDAFEMARRNRFFGRWLRHGEGYPDWTLRLFDRRHARWTDDLVHEHVVADGPVGRLDGDLLHASAESLDDYLAKQNHYTTLQAEAMHARGEHFSWIRLIGSPLVRFVRFYLLRAGFLDGAAGLVHIAIGCFASFSKYAKLRALERPAANPALRR